jgi:antitoxin (DNA-binding transcriptional repressor) of toxin-antitoxin stability system
MKTYSVGELKTKFSAVMDMVRRGEEVAVSYGRKKEKVAVIVPYERAFPARERTLGILKGKATCVIRKGFDMTDEELLER